MTDTTTAAAILPFAPNQADPAVELLATYRDIARSLQRIADALAPAPPDLVGTPYVAKRSGRTTTRVTQWVQSGELPSHCVHSGGDGVPYKFFREHIDKWLVSR
jgi:hypothetical protein